MLVTERFTYIHQPKTGGTFVTTLLTRLHEARGRVEVVWIDAGQPSAVPAVPPRGALNLMFSGRNQHGARQHIPAAFADRPILATIRNPYDRYVSQYEFAWWRTAPTMFGPLEEVRRRHPAYPDLTFAQFVHLTNDVSVPYRAASHPDGTPGFHTQQFVEYFFPDPEAAYPRLADPAFSRGVVARELRGVRFIDQTRLNEELAEALVAMGYSEADAQIVRRADRIWPPEGGRDAGSAWAPYYTAELKAFVRRKERWLFEWFPQFDRV